MEVPTYKIKEKIQVWQGIKSSWYFVHIPIELSKEIKSMFGYLKGGWGSIRVRLTVGGSTWNTSIFPDKKSGCYLIPIKSEIRKKEKLIEGQVIGIDLQPIT